MRRLVPIAVVFAVMAPAAGVLAAVAVVPPSAYAMPDFELATGAGPLTLSASDLGAKRDGNGLHVEAERFESVVADLAELVHREPVPATYELTNDQGVRLTQGEPGVKIDLEATREVLMGALNGSRSDLTVPTIELDAPAATPHAIVVKLSEFRLELYEGADLAKDYTIGIGKLDYPTPPGVYYIRQKAANPTWRNPYSRWSMDMPAYIPPGPNNPLGTRALRLDRDAIVIHGTPDPSSIGRRQSHGCVRMHRADVEELFEIVAEQTPVFIVP